MKKSIGTLLLIMILITACSPSPEAIAKQTAEAATTIASMSTPTPTPVMFVLSGRLIDAQSAKPLTGIQITAEGVTNDGALILMSGEDVSFPTVETDSDGKFVLDLPETVLKKMNYQISVLSNLGPTEQPLLDKDGKMIMLSIPKGEGNLDLGDIQVK